MSPVAARLGLLFLPHATTICRLRQTAQAMLRAAGCPVPSGEDGAHGPGAALQDVRVYPDGTHVFMSQQFLHRAGVVAALQQLDATDKSFFLLSCL